MNLTAADEKVTIFFRDCATIRVSRRYLRPFSRFAGRVPSNGVDLWGPMLYGKKISVRLSFLLVLAFTACSFQLLAQNSTEDVHIQPRVKPPAPVEPEGDPALKTHTKPYKVGVDLVLVP